MRIGHIGSWECCVFFLISSTQASVRQCILYTMTETGQGQAGRQSAEWGVPAGPQKIVDHTKQVLHNNQQYNNVKHRAAVSSVQCTWRINNENDAGSYFCATCSPTIHCQLMDVCDTIALLRDDRWWQLSRWVGKK